MAQKFKKDDLVKVIVGKDKGKTGKIISVDSKGQRLIIEGINIAKMHKKKTENFEGGIVEVPRSIHQSNVQLMCPEKNKPVKVGFKLIDGTKKRISKSTGSTF